MKYVVLADIPNKFFYFSGAVENRRKKNNFYRSKMQYIMKINNYKQVSKTKENIQEITVAPGLLLLQCSTHSV